ncbi:MAG: hypothetical protein ACYTEQ_21880 [Planctomycetota bacterium]|jgi:hypothetical protein
MNVVADSHENELVYLVFLAVTYAFFVYGLLHSVKAGRGRKRFFAPIILLTCSAAFGVPTVIRTFSCDSFSKFGYVSFTVAGTLLLLTMSLYGIPLVLTLRPAKTAQGLRDQKFIKVMMMAFGIAATVVAWLLTLYIVLVWW